MGREAPSAQNLGHSPNQEVPCLERWLPAGPEKVILLHLQSREKKGHSAVDEVTSFGEGRFKSPDRESHLKQRRLWLSDTAHMNPTVMDGFPSAERRCLNVKKPLRLPSEELLDLFSRIMIILSTVRVRVGLTVGIT